MFEKKRSVYTIIAAAMLTGMTLFMTVLASKQSFWVDELDWTIGIITGKAIFNGKLFTGMFQILLEQGYNLPLYYIIEKPLYALLPYGETYLLIPSILFVILGIIFLEKAGNAIGGTEIGFFAACIALSSATLITQGGWEIRPYAITFCFSSITFFMYLKRLKAETNRNILLYGISALLLLYCHWFGALLVLFYAFADLYFYIRKRITLKCIFAYILAGVLFLPWFLMMLLHLTRDISNYWGLRPRLLEPVMTVAYLLSNTVPYCLLFGAGFILILLKNIKKTGQKSPLDGSNIWFFTVAAVVWLMVPVYIYSRYINQSGSFYTERYFFAVMPHVFLIAAYGFSKTFYAVQHAFFRKQKEICLRCIAAALFCLVSFQNYQKAYLSVTSVREPYREAAEFLSKDKQVYSPNSLVICSGGSAWVEYYFSKRGYTIPANAAVHQSLADPADVRKAAEYPALIRLFVFEGHYIQPIVLSEADILRYDRIYLVEVHNYFSDEFVDTIQRNYMPVDDRREFSPSIPKASVLKNVVKSLLNIGSDDTKPFFGLRIYSKDA